MNTILGYLTLSAEKRPLVIIQLNGSSSLNHLLHPISCVVRNISAALNDTQTDHIS